MNFVGIDLHKKSISLSVVDQERKLADRRRFYCSETGGNATIADGFLNRT